MKGMDSCGHSAHRLIAIGISALACWSAACHRPAPTGDGPSASSSAPILAATASVSADPSASCSASALCAPSASCAPAASGSAAPAGETQTPWGDKVLHSTAIETYVRAVAQSGARAIGYLRVGASVRRSDEPVGTTGCKGGWYAIEPRGFVCANESMTLDEKAAILALAKPLPARGQPMPFPYAKVKGMPPHYYTRIPSATDMRKVEGGDVKARLASVPKDQHADLLGPAIEVPPFLAEGGRIPRPVGTAPRLRFWVHTGRADPNTRVAILSHFEAEGRHWALTSQLDLVALDRVNVVKPSSFQGVAIGEGQSLPVAFVKGRGATGYKPDESGKLSQTVALGPKQGMLLTGQTRKDKGSELVEGSDGTWVPASALIVVEPRKNIPSFVKGDDQRWLDIDIRSQSLVAYEGKRPVYATLVSTGTGFLGDPETTHATPRGVFTVFAKHVSTKMSGDELGAEYQIDDVPYVQYFHKSYALHGAFWHDDFGHVHSHGCVNLAPADAAWVFEFTNPELPKGWHGLFATGGGTTVFIHE